MGVLDHRLRVLMTETVSSAPDFGETVARAMGGEETAFAAGEPVIDFLARCSTRAAKSHLEEAGAEIRGVVPGRTTVVIGSAPLDVFADLAEVRGVERIEMARPMTLDLDLSRVDARVEPLHIPTQAGIAPARGEGVVVGVVDSGIDYRHAKFRNTDGTSRILFLWDQNDNSGLGGTVDLGDGPLSGREYTKADLDAALATADPLAAVPHADTNGHGTHVCGIAAGNGQSGLQFRGVASDADLIVVGARAEAGTLGQSTSALLAYQYVIARAGNQPVVINQSQGMNGGGHFGETVLETGIDNLLREPGVVAVKSAGNEQQWRVHAGGTIAANETVTLEFDVPQSVRQTVFLELWTGDANTFAVAVQPPGENNLQEVLADADVSSHVMTTDAGNNVILAVDRDMDQTGETQVTIALARGTGIVVRPGRWQIRARGVVVADGRYDVWIERAQRNPNRQSRFTAASAEENRNISIPGTARRIITVAAYTTRPESPGFAAGGIASLSSRGPTRLGAQKPEIAAPGEWIIAARSSDSDMTAHPDSMHTILAGTSMAAPHVAGTVALILSEQPNLTADQVRQILVRSARIDSMSMSAPDNTWGAGKLDALGAFNLANTAGFPEITSVTITSGKLTAKTDIDTTVTVTFNSSLRQLLLGKTQGTRTDLTLGRSHVLDFSDLPAGTYFCEIRAFSDDAFWTIDDNDAAGHKVIVS